MPELRVYYEAYEQAEHFLKPALLRAIPSTDSDDVKLVKLTKLKPTSQVGDSIYDALNFKDPDALITFVESNVEQPLALVEFSACVETEDHDLQRFDAFLAAARIGVPYVKIYAKRHSRRTHGGRVDYDRKLPYKLLLQRLKTPGFEIEWPLRDKFTVLRDEQFIACPPRLETFENLLNFCWNLRNKGNSLAKAILAHQGCLPGEFKRQLEVNRGRINVPTPGLRATRLTHIDGKPALKMNRWTHAMDPERGMLWFYHILYNKKLLGKLIDKSATTTDEAYDHFCTATGFDPQRLLTPPDANDVNISVFVPRASLTRAGQAIFANCDTFKVYSLDGDELLSLSWGTKPPEPRIGLRVPVTILAPDISLSEDEVTYVVAYDVLKVNGFDLLSISYPGDQGDFALIQGLGRQAKRTYVDIIAIKPGQALDLTECKGTYQTRAIEQEISFLLPWKQDQSRRDILTRRVGEALACSGGKYRGEEILVSVAFGDCQMHALSTRLKEIDFYVVVTPNSWQLWSSRIDLPFSKRSGRTSLMPRYSY